MTTTRTRRRRRRAPFSKRPQWDMLLSVVERGVTTTEVLRRQYPRKRDIAGELQQLEASKALWIAPDGKVCSLLVGTSTDSLLADLRNQREEKLLLARYVAANLVDYGDVVFLDSGTTMLNVAVQLAFSARASEIDVITNNPAIWGILRGKVRGLFLVGGEQPPASQSRIAIPDGSTILGSVGKRPGKSFISVMGVSVAKGLVCEEDLCHTKRQAIEAAVHEAIVVADASKVGRTQGDSFLRISELTGLGRPITFLTNRPTGRPPETWSAEIRRLEAIPSLRLRFVDREEVF